MTEVVKRDGGKQEFDLARVRRSIKKATLDAGLKIEDHKKEIEELTNKVKKMAEENDVISTSQIRKKILHNARTVNEKLLDSWERFENKYKSTSGGLGKA